MNGQPTGPFTGVRIADFAAGIAGSFAGMILAELGADVVKIEPPTGSAIRADIGSHVWNRSKRSVVVDPGDIAQGSKVEEILQWADVAISDLGDDEERAAGLPAHDSNPRLIRLVMPPLGSKGPFRDLPRDDDLVAAFGGLMATQWAYREGPVCIVSPISSYGAAMLAAAAVGAALLARERTGQGQRVEVPLISGALLMQIGAAFARVSGESEPLWRWSHDPLGGMSPVFRAYPAADGKWIFIACGSQEFWNKLCIALDLTHLISDPRFGDAPWVPIQQRQALIDIIEPIIAAKPRDEWLEYFKACDVPRAPVNTRQEFIADPQVLHNGMRIEVEDPELGKTVQMGVPARLSLSPATVRGPAPRIGQHTAEFFAQLAVEDRPAAPDDKQLSAKGPLSGFTVLEFGRFVAGPVVGRLLADLGADVIKVESLQGDPARVAGYSFMSRNRDKRSLAVNLASPEGRALIHGLARRADVVIENFRNGVAQSLGLDYETLRQVNPQIVVSSIRGYGEDGPYADLPCYDPLIQAQSGLMRAQGGADEPAVLYATIGDVTVAIVCAYSTIAALYHRQRTGQGQHVQTSLIDCVAGFQSGEMLFYDGKPPGRQGGRDLLGISALRRLYQTSDGWLMLAADKPEYRRGLIAAMDEQSLCERLAAPEALERSTDSALSSALATHFAKRTLAECLTRLRSNGVPCSPALTFGELCRDPQAGANSLFTIEDHPQWGELWMTANFAKFSAFGETGARRAPLLGEHTGEVLANLLGLKPEAIAQLRRDRQIR